MFLGVKWQQTPKGPNSGNPSVPPGKELELKKLRSQGHLSPGQFFVLFWMFFVFCFLGPQVQHVEVPKLGGPNRATAAGLHHSHSNMGSEPCLQPTP